MLQRNSHLKLPQEDLPPEKSKFLAQVKLSSAQKKLSKAGNKSHRINLTTIARQPEDNRYKYIDSKTKSSFDSVLTGHHVFVDTNENSGKLSNADVMRQKRTFSVNNF